jgi:MFS-type transporter involved in bile tolerance (Atg22 family)
MSFLTTVLDFFGKEEGLMSSCFTAVTTSQSTHNLIRHPIRVTIGGLIGSVILSDIIKFFANNKQVPYISFAMFAISLIGFFHRIFFTDFRSNDKGCRPFIDISYNSNK